MLPLQFVFYIRSLIREKAKPALIILVSLILAGALGNILDSIFYGKMFSASSYHQLGEFMPDEGGYAPFFMGHVVDMLYFPIIDTTYPEWLPVVGGDRLQFFRPVFNIADAAISMGIITILVFRTKLFDQPPTEEESENNAEDMVEKTTESIEHDSESEQTS